MKAKLMSTLSPFGGGQGEERYKTKGKNKINQIKILEICCTGKNKEGSKRQFERGLSGERRISCVKI